MSTNSGYHIKLPPDCRLTVMPQDAPTVVDMLQGVLVFQNGLLLMMPFDFRLRGTEVRPKEISFGDTFAVMSARGSDHWRVTAAT